MKTCGRDMVLDVEDQEKLIPPEEIKPQFKYALLKSLMKWEVTMQRNWHHS